MSNENERHVSNPMVRPAGRHMARKEKQINKYINARNAWTSDGRGLGLELSFIFVP